MDRIVLQANDGKILTNGEIYGVCVFLAEGAKAEDFYEITREEYENILSNIELEMEEETELKTEE